TALANREIILCPDNDEAGRRYADGATLKLLALGAKVRRMDVDLLGLPPKGDLVDWLDAFEYRTQTVATKADIGRLPTICIKEEALDPNETTLDVASNGQSPEVKENDDAAIARLAAMPPLQYDRVRSAEAEKMDVRLDTLDKLVKKAREPEDEKIRSPFDEVEKSPEPVDGAELLDDMAATIHRYIVCEWETAVTVALWCVFTWLVDRVQVAPLLVITAPEKRCGKSQLLDLIGRLSRRPLRASNISPAAMFRVIEAHGPTLLIDEADSFLKQNEELRGVINSGHTRQSAYVIRTVGDDHEPQQFSTWGAKAICGIGRLSDTIMDRALVVELRRKLPSESVERLRYAEPGLFDELVSRMARYADDSGAEIERARPELPDTLNDRAQDNWDPLLAIADHAKGEWPKRARLAAEKISGVLTDAVSVSAELLADIRTILEGEPGKTQIDRISTAELLESLTRDKLKRWATYNKGMPMSPRQLANKLADYGIRSQDIRFPNNRPLKGYKRAQFEDAFSRYLSPPADTPYASATPRQINRGERIGVADSAQCRGSETVNATRVSALDNACSAVADSKPVSTCAEAGTHDSALKSSTLRI
ncbi:MAG: DUF3631 domain-containing protein, partial [Nitrosospira sp.]